MNLEVRHLRVAVVSDIHGNLPALEAVVKDIARRDVDCVVNLGDNVSGPLMPLETAQFLMAQDDWVHLAGNHERQLLTLGAGERGLSDEFAHSQLGAKEFAWLATLKPVHRLNREVLLCHGTPTSDIEYFLETAEPGNFRAANASEVDARYAVVERVSTAFVVVPSVFFEISALGLVRRVWFVRFQRNGFSRLR